MDIGEKIELWSQQEVLGNLAMMFYRWEWCEWPSEFKLVSAIRKHRERAPHHDE